MSITEQVLRAPNVGEDLEPRRDDHASEILHVAQVANTCDVLLGEASQHLILFEVVQNDRSV